MQIHGPAHVHGAQAINAPHANRAPQAAPNAASAAPSDELSLSTVGQLIDRVHDLPEIRADRVNAIRAQIAAGTYETDAKLDAALDRLLDEIG